MGGVVIVLLVGFFIVFVVGGGFHGRLGGCIIPLFFVVVLLAYRDIVIREAFARMVNMAGLGAVVVDLDLADRDRVLTVTALLWHVRRLAAPRAGALADDEPG